MRYFHLTSRWHLPRIVTAGFLKLGESNLRPDGRGGPPVVWLTTDPTPKQTWQQGSATDKSTIRFTVEVEGAHHWPAWAKAYTIQPWWYQALAETGGDPEAWWVVTHPITKLDWLKIEETDTGAVVWTRGQPYAQLVEMAKTFQELVGTAKAVHHAVDQTT